MACVANSVAVRQTVNTFKQSQTRSFGQSRSRLNAWNTQLSGHRSRGAVASAKEGGSCAAMLESMPLNGSALPMDGAVRDDTAWIPTKDALVFSNSVATCGLTKHTT